MSDNVNHPSHYNQYPIEVIDIVEDMTFCMGNVVKYVLRAPYKNKDKLVEDCQKALWYLERQNKKNHDWTIQVLPFNPEPIEELKKYLMKVPKTQLENQIQNLTLAFLLLIEDFCENPLDQMKYENLKNAIHLISEIKV